MGFNKLFLGEKTLNHYYENGGASSVLEYLSKYDAYISTDEFSINLIVIIDSLHATHHSRTKEEFLEKIDELFTITNK